MRSKLLEDIVLAEMELGDANYDELEFKVVLEFAENILLNASNLWRTASLAQKQRLQQVLFPEGIQYINGEYRTTTNCLLFMQIEGTEITKEGLVALTGIEPVFED
ncbi:MAG: hypothetical protein QOD84_1104 [Acidobacteriaceae bacterium]|jgi:hypothetical protein